MQAKGTNLFAQIIALIERDEFHRLVRKFGNDKHSKGFSSWDQLVSMLFCHLGKAQSLREICGGLATCMGKLVHLRMQEAPKRSTLSYANKHRDYHLFEELYYQLLAKCKQQCHGKRKFRFRNKLFSVDASVIELCLNMFNWATYRKTKGAVKLHCVLDHDGYLPVFACISEGRPHDLKVAKRAIFPNFPFPAGSIVVIDLGYYDFELFGLWCATGIYFVVRMKSNTGYEALERYALPKDRKVLKDERIHLTGFYSQQKCPYELRRLEVWNEERQEIEVFLTNNFALSSTTIAAIHKDRWQIETFFKALKQNLKVKTFVGTSPNALKIQLWTALIAMLLLKYLKMLSTFNWSLSNLIAMLRFNLFTYRDLLEWLNAPFDCLIEEPGAAQLELHFGQQ